MTIETDFLAVLTAYAPLTALVPAARISQHRAKQGSALPLIVFAAQHAPDEGLDGDVQAELCTFSVECWAESAESAGEVASQVVAALDVHDALPANGSLSVSVTNRQSVSDDELELDGEAVTVEWWRL